MLAWVLTVAHVCVCHKSGLSSKLLNESSWFWHGSFLSPILCCYKEFGYLQNKGTSLWNTVPNSVFWKSRHGRKVKPIRILLKQKETISGSGISWAVCKSARRSRQITIVLSTKLVDGWACWRATRRGWTHIVDRNAVTPLFRRLIG